MDKKTLYMIGNSHIDPVWFWDWDEGMQEVKATFSSALDRLEEFDDMKFTSTSSAFFEWLEKISPKMFEEIQRRVIEGRWELTGGWYIEPDCHIPSGESFVRQGLYGQRYFKSRFNKYVTTGSNVDSFGHSEGLPQILKKSGMKNYVCMRTGLTKETPLFNWTSKDGSFVKTISLPSEYTTWFHESTKKGIEDTISATKNFSGLPCCYGVGNHGGGPTIENVKSIISLKEDYNNINIKFGTFEEFFESLTKEDIENMPTIDGSFENINVGCYSIDSEFKKLHRLTEKRLTVLEGILTLEKMYSGKTSITTEELEKLWKVLLFNEFHDTLGGTYVKSAREEAVMQLSGVCAECKRLWAKIIQNIINSIDTTGEGFPLILFNPTTIDYNGPIHTELNWFCKDELLLRDYNGVEIPYQRVHTEAKVRNYNLGGRRGIIFNLKIPALGFAIYRTEINNSKLCCDVRGGSAVTPYIIENDKIKVSFNKKTGFLCSVIDKETNYDAIVGDVTFDIWKDERDSWGGIQGRPFYDTNEKFKLEKLETIECGDIRKVVRGIYKCDSCKITQLFILYNNSDELIVENYIYWDKPWHMLKHRLPINVENYHTQAEGAYSLLERDINDAKEYYMHRFLDIWDKEKEHGLLFVNDSKYGFSMDKNELLVTVLRSSIYAQGNGIRWYEPLEHYEFTDIGEQKFKYAITPHGKKISVKEKYTKANAINDMILYIADNKHSGYMKEKSFKGISVEADNVIVTSTKECEDSRDYIFRLLEINGQEGEFNLTVNDKVFKIHIKSYELKTLKIDEKFETCIEVDLLERVEES